jgi:tetraacyldisaccharide 4'-kinase
MTEQHHTSRLQQWLETIWYRGGKGAFLLMPLSALYCTANRLQRWIQSRYLTTLACPVIVVGNITLGGTGKTPLAIYIVKLLQKQGYKPAIITRGYGGKSSHWPQSVTPHSDPQQVGDEAVLMARRTGVPVYAGANRLASIKALLAQHDCDVIVSDDGLQHYKLPRDIAIAVVDAGRGLGNGYCLPAGPLREKKQRLDECDFILVNGKGSFEKNTPNQSFSFYLKGDSLIGLQSQKEQALDLFVNQTVHAVTGIGNPARFYKTLGQGGLSLVKHSFPDHHDFKPGDLQFADDHPIVMTEKDAVKCMQLAIDEALAQRCWYLPVTAKLDDRFDTQLLQRLEKIGEEKHG